MKRRAWPAIILVVLVAIGSIAYVFNRARPTADVIATCDLDTKPIAITDGVINLPLVLDKETLRVGDKLKFSVNVPISNKLPLGIDALDLGGFELGAKPDHFSFTGTSDDNGYQIATTLADGTPTEFRLSNAPTANNPNDIYTWPNIWVTNGPQQLPTGIYSLEYTITSGVPGWHSVAYSASHDPDPSISSLDDYFFSGADYFCIQPPLDTTSITPVNTTPISTPIITNPITDEPTNVTPNTTTSTETSTAIPPTSTSTTTPVDTTTGTTTPTTSTPTPTDSTAGAQSTTQDTTTSTSTTSATTPVASSSASTTTTQEVVTVAATTVPSTTSTTTSTTSTEVKTPAPTQSTLQVASSALASTNTAPTAPATSSSTSTTTTTPTSTSTTSTTSTAATTTNAPTVKAGAPVVVKLKGTTPKKPVTISVNGKAVTTVTPTKANVDVPVTIPVSTPDGKATVTAHSDSWSSDLSFPVKVASAKAGMSTEKRNSLIGIIIFIALLSIGILYVVFGGQKKTENPQPPVDPQIPPTPPTEPPLPPTTDTPTPTAQY